MPPKHKYERLHLSLLYMLHVAQLKDEIMNIEENQRCACHSLQLISKIKSVENDIFTFFKWFYLIPNPYTLVITTKK